VSTIQVFEDTKRSLEQLKRDGETFDELLTRLMAMEEPINVGAWSKAEADRVRETIERSRRSFDRE
jgi:predicted CopG family antitoxin